MKRRRLNINKKLSDSLMERYSFNNSEGQKESKNPLEKGKSVLLSRIGNNNHSLNDSLNKPKQLIEMKERNDMMLLYRKSCNTENLESNIQLSESSEEGQIFVKNKEIKNNNKNKFTNDNFTNNNNINNINKLSNIITINNTPYKSMEQPLLLDNLQLNVQKNTIVNSISRSISKNNLFIYNVEKYDENCIEESKIKSVRCLLEDDKKKFFYLFFSIVTFGIFTLLLEIFPLLKVKFGFFEVGISKATHFLIDCYDGKYYIVKAYEIELPTLRNGNIVNYTKLPIIAVRTKTFEFKLHKYAYSPEIKNFISVSFNLTANYDIISRKMKVGLNEEEIQYQKIFIYKNRNVHDVKSIKDIIMSEISSPFYYIQLFCIISFFINEYSFYAKILLFSSILILLLTLFETKYQIEVLHKLSSYECQVSVIRKKETKTINSDKLVPGDIIIFPENDFILPCDVLIVAGSAVVNECFITGESIPVFKDHIPNNMDKFEKDSQSYMIFAGSKMIQSRKNALGLVTGIGFDTKKGKMVREILFKEDRGSVQKKNKEIMKGILYILIFGLIGIIISIRQMILNNLSIIKIILFSLDLLTTILPPALPISVVISSYMSNFRLKHDGLTCLDRSKINVAGKVNMICFDKTGTLTEDYVELYGCRMIGYNKNAFIFSSFIDEIEEIAKETTKFYFDKIDSEKNSNTEPKGVDKDNIFLLLKLGKTNQEKTLHLRLFYIEALATCHCLIKVNDNLVGDTIDLEMFNSTGWTLEESQGKDPLTLATVKPGENNIEKNSDSISSKNLDKKYELKIIRRFDFASNLQRQSVIVKDINEEYFKVYCKGSPEKIVGLCRPETIPQNFNRLLHYYTNQGLRVVSLSFKLIKMHFIQSQKIARESVEHEMIFLGFFIVKNKLKPYTKRTINIIKDAGINTLVSTGDNVFTAASVAKECHIVPEDQAIYQIDVNPISGSSEYELTFKELTLELLEDETESSDDEEDESNDPFILTDNETKRKYSRNVNKMLVESIDDEDLESESVTYDENDIHLIIKKQKQLELKELKIPNIKIKKYHCFAITGSTFQILYNLSLRHLEDEYNNESKIYYETFSLILSKTLIFARMLPEHKTLLIDCLKKENNSIVMCGDGANDIGALRTADLGISLGLDETIISAHFVSRNPDIRCLIVLLCEGKACISNLLGTYKYMIMLSVIQFITYLFLLVLGSTINANQCLLIDLFIIFPTAILIARTDPIKILTDEEPLIINSNSVLSTAICQSIIMFFFQFLIYQILCHQSWYIDSDLFFPEDNIIQKDTNLGNATNQSLYKISNNTNLIAQLIYKVKIDGELKTHNYDNTVLFFMDYTQSLISIIIFSRGNEFKAEISNNKGFLYFLVANALFAIYLIFVPNETIYDFFDLVEIKSQNIKFIIVLLSVINFFVSDYAEKLVVQKLSQKMTEDKERKTILNN